MEEKTVAGSGQDPNTVCLQDECGHLCVKGYCHDTEVVESHGEDAHRIGPADSDNRDSGCLLVQGRCFVDREVNVLAFAYICQRSFSMADHKNSPMCAMELLLLTAPTPSISKG